MDYSGCRKTHRFPPPYGLGSLSLTHRPTENPTGVTILFSVTLNSIQSRIVERIGKGLNNLKPSIFAGDSGSWAGVTHFSVTLNSFQCLDVERIAKYCCSLPNSGRAGVGSGCFLSFRAPTRNRIVGRIIKD